MMPHITLKGRIAITVFAIYGIIALIVPMLPLHNPQSYHAPPEDIFVPEVVDEYAFNFTLEHLRVYGYGIYMITEDGRFVVYDSEAHRIENAFPIPPRGYSEIGLMRAMYEDYPVFFGNGKVYIYIGDENTLLNYTVPGIRALYPLREPFNGFYGFLVVNSSGIYAFEYDPFMPWRGVVPVWSMKITQRILGIHYTYKRIMISTPKSLICVNSEGEVVWSVNGSFTSNPIFVPVYGSKSLYIGSENYIEVRSILNGSILKRISMPSAVDSLAYYGQALYAHSRSSFGKVNLMEGGFAWKIDNVRRYRIDPFVDGVGILLNSGKLEFVLAASGEVQWGLEGKFRDIALGSISHVSYLYALNDGGNVITKYSYSGKLITPLPPDEKYPLGTDAAGRDVLSQFLWSFREEMYIALLSGLIVLILGTLWGLVAGYYSGVTDDFLLLVSDALLFIPAIGYAALMLYVFGIVHHVEATIAASVLALSPLEARAVRNYTKMIKEKPYVESAKVIGASSWRIIFNHILPEIRGISLVYAVSAVAMALLLEVGISFLGFGNYGVPTWGWMVTNAYFTGYLDRWWLVAPPIIALWLLVYSLYLIFHEIYTSYYLRQDMGKKQKNKS